MKDSNAIRLPAMLAVPFLCLWAAWASCEPAPETVIRNMETAWAGLEDYRARVEVRTYRSDGSSEIRKFLYTFRKPCSIRLDLEWPHPGMVLIFPDKEGKVLVKPSGVVRLFHFHLSPASPRLTGISGQRIDQTDLGDLIRNISSSLTYERRGPVTITENDGRLIVQVLGVNHFRPAVLTSYRFFIDTRTWLPSRVEESTREGRLERQITFRDLEINTQVAHSLFETG